MFDYLFSCLDSYLETGAEYDYDELTEQIRNSLDDSQKELLAGVLKVILEGHIVDNNTRMRFKHIITALKANVYT